LACKMLITKQLIWGGLATSLIAGLNRAHETGLCSVAMNFGDSVKPVRCDYS
jgi:hypothetical protein